MSALVQELEEHYLQDSLQFCLSSFLFIVSIISDQNDTNKFLLIWDSLEMYVCILAPSPPTFSLTHLECICFPVLLWLCQTQRAFTVWWQGQVSRAMGLGPGKSVFLFSYMRAALSISFHFPAKKTLSAGSFLCVWGWGDGQLFLFPLDEQKKKSSSKCLQQRVVNMLSETRLLKVTPKISNLMLA